MTLSVTHQNCAMQSAIGGHHTLHCPVAGVGHIIRCEAHHVIQGLHVVSLGDADLVKHSLENIQLFNLKYSIPVAALGTTLQSSSI